MWGAYLFLGMMLFVVVGEKFMLKDELIKIVLSIVLVIAVIAYYALLR